jgi:hypothetical protein
MTALDSDFPQVDRDGFPILPPMRKRDIIERIMTQHWDMAACRCWVCTAGRGAGCRPNIGHAEHYPDVIRLPHVHVGVVPRHDDAEN